MDKKLLTTKPHGKEMRVKAQVQTISQVILSVSNPCHAGNFERSDLTRACSGENGYYRPHITNRAP